MLSFISPIPPQSDQLVAIFRLAFPYVMTDCCQIKPSRVLVSRAANLVYNGIIHSGFPVIRPGSGLPAYRNRHR
uniref:Uncharacterized protein n=1 Tax=Candidatus Kentrum sp. DK TaxID=2126562 RepID=A0A450SEK0_9GAMM|nr:MAG: hypothetical protein BECKDK2373B_GA0170837_103218 [Candidatus Kentron sp. DK]